LSDLNTGLTGVERLIRQADTARDHGDPEGAAAIYRQVLAQSPDRNDVKVQLGNMLKDAGHLREAASVYREAQAADPDNADICVQMGHVLKLMGNRTAAFEQYHRAVALNPNSWAATQELAEAGYSWQQRQRFEVNLRSKGAEALMMMSRQIAAMRKTLDAMSAMLPDTLAQTAFPIDLYDSYRELYAVPPPPDGRRVSVTILLLADREEPTVLYRQLAAVRAQTNGAWTLRVVGQDSARAAIVALAATADPRIVWVAAEVDPAAAEWAAARAAPGDWLLLLAPGAILQPQALAWFATAPRLAAARAFVADEDRIAFGRGLTQHSEPVLRQVVDYDTLLEANVFGETIAVARDAYAAAFPVAPSGSPGRARSRLLLDLAREGGVGHLPYALVSTLDGAASSLPEHRLAVEDHAAAHGFADRILIAKGEKGVTHWVARDPTATIAVIIPTRDNPHDLRTFIQSLRSTADMPDHLRLVVLPNGTSQPETFDVLAELGGKRHTTVIEGETPFNWSRINNMAVQAIDAPHVVFANDDMLMMTENWDTRLRGLLERDEIGAVGARLLYGDDTVQHAGVLFGWKDNVIHDGLYEPADAPGPARRLHVTRAASAVTGAFLAVRRERFLSVGGFDEVGLPIAYSDVDFALKLRQRGLKVLWTPAITLRHYESKTRGMDHPDAAKNMRNKAELAVMDARWGSVLSHDPSLHPAWYAATLPFRLIVAPSSEDVLDHIRRTAEPDPWRVTPVA
jgi:GT2 family glycosyltransferase/tetratricopeptide (TPR) repeat protein